MGSCGDGVPRWRSPLRLLPLRLLSMLLALLAWGAPMGTAAAAAAPSPLTWTVQSGPHSSVRIVAPPPLDGDGAPVAGSRAVVLRAHLAYTAAFADKWLPLNGPLKDGFVPTNCAAPHDRRSNCIAGGGFFAHALSGCRRAVAQRNETCLAMFPGDWVNGNSFARAAGGTLAADYAYLAGFDAVAFSSTDFHTTMGTNFSRFQERMRHNFGGAGTAGGPADTLRHPTPELLDAAQREGLLLHATSPSHMPLLMADVRVATWAQQSRPFSLLDPLLPPLPGMESAAVLDTSLDAAAVRAGACSLQHSSCSRTATQRLGIGRAGGAEDGSGTDGGNSDDDGDGDDGSATRLAIVPFNVEDLTAISAIGSVFPLPPGRVAFQDAANQWALLQKQVSALAERGVQHIAVLTATILSAAVMAKLQLLYHVDVVISAQVELRPQWALLTGPSGAPMLFLSCSTWMLHFCVASLEFDRRGALLAATLNATETSWSALEGAPGHMDSPLGARILADYAAIVSNASATVVGHKAYPSPRSDPMAVRFFETEDGSAVADSGRWVTGAQVSMASSGGIRTILPAGPIVLSSMGTLLPFENSWVRVRVSGSLLWSALENSVSLASVSDPAHPEYAIGGRGKFMQMSGLRFTWNPLAPTGSKVLTAHVLRVQAKPSTPFDASFNLDATPGASDPAAVAAWRNQSWAPVDPDASYTLAVSSFVFADGDGFTFQSHPECEAEATNLGTQQIVLQNYLAAYDPIWASVAERRIVRDHYRFAPVLLSVAPTTGDIKQTNLLLLAGHYLYAGSDARHTSVQLRITLAGSLGDAGGAIHVECRVLPQPLPSRPASESSAGVEVQLVRCLLEPPPISDASLIRAVRFLVDSGPTNGSVAFSPVTPSLFNFTTGSASDNCLRYEGTLFQAGRCVCAGGYQRVDFNSSGGGGGLDGDDTSLQICTPCPAGYLSGGGDDACRPCPSGSFNTDAASSLCYPCAVNTFAPQPGSTHCDACPAHSYTDFNLAPTRSRCFCDPGFVAAEDLRRVFERAAGVYRNYSLESDALPSGRVSAAPPGVLPASFISPSGAHEFSCVACPAGALCDAVSGDVRSTPGYWLDAHTRSMLLCPHIGSCCTDPQETPEGSAYFAAPESVTVAASASGLSGSCALHLSSSACGSHRSGYVCAVCDSGFQAQSGAGSRRSSCVECEEANGPMVVGLVAVCLLYLAYSLFSSPSTTHLTIILLDYYQMTSLALQEGTLSTGGALHAVLSALNLHADAMLQSSSDDGVCLLPTSTLATIVLRALMGPMLLCSLGILAAAARLLPARWAPPRWRFRKAAWQLLLFGFLGSIGGTLELLGCRRIGSRRLLIAAPDVECWVGDHLLVGSLAIAWSVLLCVLVPLAIIRFVRKLTNTIQHMTAGDGGGRAQTTKQTTSDADNDAGIGPRPASASVAAQLDLRRQTAGLYDSLAVTTLLRARWKQRTGTDATPQAQPTPMQTATDASGTIAPVTPGSFGESRAGAYESGPARRSLIGLHDLLLSHGLLFVSYTRRWCWFEALYLVRRVLVALPFALLPQDSAVSLLAWLCAALLLLHSQIRVFSSGATQTLHQLALFSLLSLCLLQQHKASLTGGGATPVWHVAAWLCVLVPPAVFLAVHPATRPLCRSLRAKQPAAGASPDRAPSAFPAASTQAQGRAPTPGTWTTTNPRSGNGSGMGSGPRAVAATVTGTRPAAASLPASAAASSDASRPAAPQGGDRQRILAGGGGRSSSSASGSGEAAVGGGAGVVVVDPPPTSPSALASPLSPSAVSSPSSSACVAPLPSDGVHVRLLRSRGHSSGGVQLAEVGAPADPAGAAIPAGADRDADVPAAMSPSPPAPLARDRPPSSFRIVLANTPARKQMRSVRL